MRRTCLALAVLLGGCTVTTVGVSSTGASGPAGVQYQALGEVAPCATTDWEPARARIVSVDSWWEERYALFACVTFELEPATEGAEPDRLHMHDARVYLIGLPYVRVGDTVPVRVRRTEAPGRQIVLDYPGLGVATCPGG